jgi:hypothetical protein
MPARPLTESKNTHVGLRYAAHDRGHDSEHMTEQRAVSVGGYCASWTIFANGFRAKWISPTKYALISRGPPLAVAFAINVHLLA